MTRYAPRCLSLLAGICAAVPLPASSLERLPLPAGCKPAQRSAQARPMEAMDVPVFPPVQLDVRTPFEPSAFSAGGYRYLVYELQLQNYSEASLRVEAVDVLTPAPDGAELLLRISGQALRDQMRLVGSGAVDSEQTLETGRAGTVFLCVAFDGSFPVPDRLLHRVVLDSAVAQGPEVGTQHDAVKVLSSPVRGSHWLADNGLALDLHHRPGVFVAGGTAQISRRYAIDWKRRVDGKLLAGDPLDVRSYHAYGEPVFAVADATIIQARDGFPDNIPRTPAGFTPAVPLSMESLAGNTVVLDLGDGQFAHYAHLQRGSVAVKAGQRVKRGELLANIGNSGDARWPHLHFQVTTGPGVMSSEGVPFVLDHFRAKGPSGQWTVRRQEYPLLDSELDL
ncbi:TPA: M23 family metallopeptidase [Stenotrophomonas maltophilia]|uniref:M23 family metallopeptidase n=1 Tax=Stenotrophomonas maltophilia TaxID=40324 RepID=A0AAI9BYK6_STEMA|nr:M23 family metallopeptidase [Stenotrophomonas maltophilia]UUS13653.1 M23 family metallopeptidase [Stenotrophomonas sp. CD2]HDS1130374.1 M23 family metallopeptidase [Stenotrophomonas maltophilia]HDS1158680.1 M23 family metallopeptidase [Stenotrophomonas maltophilia]HDS1168180.1 M23 family metallopeptidase [Stenotrophomonas maltophilia]